MAQRDHQGVRRGGDVAPEERAGLGDHAVDPLEALVLHPLRSAAVIAGDEVEAAAAGDGPDRVEPVLVLGAELLLERLSQADPEEVGLFVRDVGEDFLFAAFEEAVVAADDFETRVHLFEQARAFGIGLFRTAKQVECPPAFLAGPGEVMNHVGGRRALGNGLRAVFLRHVDNELPVGVDDVAVVERGAEFRIRARE